jgi:hypothetical protein
MITPEIISYIKTEREKNTPDSMIRYTLLENGWSSADISEAMSPSFDAANGSLLEESPWKKTRRILLKILLVFLIIFGLLFAYCVYVFSP